MRCQRYRYRYTLVIQAKRPLPREAQLEHMDVILAKTRWMPEADIYETPDRVYLTLDLSGVDPEDVEISLYENALVIEGQRLLKTPSTEKGKYQLAEIKQGPFYFELPLASLQAGQVEINYKNGLLYITLEKKEGG